MAIGRLSSSIDYEELRQARILENKARLASLGLQKTIFDLRAITSPTKSAVTNIRKWPKKEYTLTSLRRSNRLKGIHAQDDATMAIGRLNTTINYEDLRRARILENKARLASLGLQQTISDLRAIASPAKSAATSVRKHTKEVYSLASLRRSDRLKRLPAQGNTGDASNSLRRSARLKRVKNHLANPFPVSAGGSAEVVNKHTPANKPLLNLGDTDYQLSPEASARRCNSKGRGSVYDPIFGICCHFCRQKTLCSEEDCKRCGNLNVNEPCIGKTDCSVCHSGYGVLCRGCLKVRYGEEMEEVRENKEWMCPHCVEAKGLNPFWICNSSMCLRKRNKMPTGRAICRAREMGYKSVAHLLMAELQRAAG
ncbi:cell division cycle-associated 7-like protein [Punica granatum]|uniref:Cell division cycle-associated 7-like protein n=1 Tax=Punica granatum TaxID=22663 RepID=A0A6P8E7Y1_PUNGR|nr:cell division cycle-associated 7-like protein [Punica granatum]